MNQKPSGNRVLGLTVLAIAMTALFVFLPPQEPKSTTESLIAPGMESEAPEDVEASTRVSKTSKPTVTLPPLPRRAPPSTSAFTDSPTTPSVHIQPVTDTSRPPAIHDGGIAGNGAIGATIRGKVTLQGTPPPEKQIIDLHRNRDCGPLHKQLITTQFYRVASDGGLADTFVLLSRAKDAPVPALPTAEKRGSVLIDQVGCVFLPSFVGLQTGQELRVRNSDPLMHNVHFVPGSSDNKESNKAQMPKSPDQLYTFEKAGVVKLRCDVHPWMNATIIVVDQPYFTITDTNGTFTITNVPPGTYTAVAIHRKAATVQREIIVTVPTTQTVTFDMQAK